MKWLEWGAARTATTTRTAAAAAAQSAAATVLPLLLPPLLFTSFFAHTHTHTAHICKVLKCYRCNWIDSAATINSIPQMKHAVQSNRCGASWISHGSPFRKWISCAYPHCVCTWESNESIAEFVLPCTNNKWLLTARSTKVAYLIWIPWCQSSAHFSANFLWDLRAHSICILHPHRHFSAAVLMLMDEHIEWFHAK